MAEIVIGVRSSSFPLTRYLKGKTNFTYSFLYFVSYADGVLTAG